MGSCNSSNDNDGDNKISDHKENIDSPPLNKSDDESIQPKAPIMRRLMKEYKELERCYGFSPISECGLPSERITNVNFKSIINEFLIPDISEIVSTYLDIDFECKLYRIPKKIYPSEVSISPLVIRMRGPPNTAYETGYFYFTIFPRAYYPFQIPVVFCLNTSVYHPHFEQVNHISRMYDFPLDDFWNPSITLQTCIITLYSMLRDPLLTNSNAPAQPLAEALYKKDRLEYHRLATENTEQCNKNPMNWKALEFALVQRKSYWKDVTKVKK